MKRVPGRDQAPPFSCPGKIPPLPESSSPSFSSSLVLSNLLTKGFLSQQWGRGSPQNDQEEMALWGPHVIWLGQHWVCTSSWGVSLLPQRRGSEQWVCGPGRQAEVHARKNSHGHSQPARQRFAPHPRRATGFGRMTAEETGGKSCSRWMAATRRLLRSCQFQHL